MDVLFPLKITFVGHTKSLTQNNVPELRIEDISRRKEKRFSPMVLVFTSANTVARGFECSDD